MNGRYIDLDIEIKDKNGSKVDGYSENYDVGDAQLQMSQRVYKDGKYEFMPLSYPKLVTKGSKQIFKFRFSKFSKTMVYDPLFAFTQKRDPTNVDVGTIILIVIIVILSATCLIVGWLYCKPKDYKRINN